MNLDTKIEVSVGCTNFLVSEIESLRRQNEILTAEKNVMEGFFSLIDRLGAKPSVGFGSDQLWQAKQEIEKAKSKLI